MMINRILTAGLSFMIAVGCFSSLSADGLRSRRPARTPEMAQRMHAKAQQARANFANANNQATLMADPDPAFQGWWQMVSRGSCSGFGFGNETDDIDSYIYIDLTEYDPITNPVVQINTVCGTPLYPRECTNCDVDGGAITDNFYYIPDSTSLVSIFDLNGPAFDPVAGQSYWSLKLQSDGISLVASFDSEPYYEGYGTNACLFRKIDEPPHPIRPFNNTSSSTFPSVNNPVDIAKYYYNALTYNNYNSPQNVNLDDGDYLPFLEREANFNKMLNEGITYETRIRRIRVSQPGPHTVQEIGADYTSSDLVTDIFTDGFSFCTAGSTVTISGFKGRWARLNGTYENGVAIIEEGAVPNPSPEHVDINSTEHQREGTFRNTYNHFLLDFDTSDPEKFPRNELGFATCVEGEPVVTVTHRFTADMEYPAFFAATRALFYQNYQISQHNAHVAYFKPGSIFLFDTWNKLKKAVANSNYVGSDTHPGDNLIRTRTAQSVPSGFYNNVVLAERGVVLYNDPFGLDQAPGTPVDYNIVLANYIVQPKNLYYAIAGTPTGPTQFDPVTIGYKPVIPGPEVAHFVGTLGDIVVVDGIPQPQNPDPVHYTLLGNVDDPDNDLFNSNGYYVGLIDPSLTQGKKVGYLRWVDELQLDPGFYLPTSTFPPNVPVTARYGREAYANVISNYTRYFQTELDCDAVILDVRTNNGGYASTEFGLAEFFGADRAATPTAPVTAKDDGFSALLELSDPLQYDSYNDIVSLDLESLARFYVTQNETNYGADTIFRGTSNRPKKVVILTDSPAASGGDIFSHYFLGENLDGNLGSFTTTKIIGDIDGRLKGSGSFRNPSPVDLTGNFLYDENGDPFPLFAYRADLEFGGTWTNGVTDIYFNQQSDLVAPSFAPSLRGTAGGAPLPNDYSTTVWPDIGLIKLKHHFSPEIPKGKPVYKDRSTWRDCWLEQAILEAIKS